MLDTLLENCIVYITVGDRDSNAPLSDTDCRLKRMNTMRASVSGLLAAPADKTISANERRELVAAVITSQMSARECRPMDVLTVFPTPRRRARAEAHWCFAPKPRD
jgi:hypothetical protein